MLNKHAQRNLQYSNETGREKHVRPKHSNKTFSSACISWRAKTRDCFRLLLQRVHQEENTSSIATCTIITCLKTIYRMKSRFHSTLYSNSLPFSLSLLFFGDKETSIQKERKKKRRKWEKNIMCFSFFLDRIHHIFLQEYGNYRKKFRKELSRIIYHWNWIIHTDLLSYFQPTLFHCLC